jgi:hypothetical protein
MKLNAEALAIHARKAKTQEALRRKLRQVDAAQLRQRPPSNAWSPMENVRHLLFAEQHHFKPHLPKGFRWSSVGVPPPNRTGETRLSPVGSDPATTIDEVFDAWAKVHTAVLEFASEDPSRLAWRVDRNLQHVMHHTRTIERLLGGEVEHG